MKNSSHLIWLFLALLMPAFLWFKTDLPQEGSPKIPENMPQADVTKSPFYDKLVQSYGRGLAHERLKIDYLFHQILHCEFEFVRNGILFDKQQTVKHLRRKYGRQISTIKTAEEFIAKVASVSSSTGKPYLVKAQDGKVYYSKAVLHYELEQLENYLKENVSGVHSSQIQPASNV